MNELEALASLLLRVNKRQKDEKITQAQMEKTLCLHNRSSCHIKNQPANVNCAPFRVCLF